MKSSFRLSAAVLTAAVLGLVGSDAGASPVSYDFTVTATSGPLSGDIASGSFTFDSSSIPLGGGKVNAAGLLTALDFTWDSIPYTASNANTGFLTFDASGALTQATFGNNCGAGFCAVNGGTEAWATALFPMDPAEDFFLYATPNSPNDGSGTASVARIPEPMTLSLFGAGLIGAAAMRRRKAKQ